MPSAQQNVLERNNQVRALPSTRAAQPLKDALKGKPRRPKGFWKDKYIEKQDNHAKHMAGQAEGGQQHSGTGTRTTSSTSVGLRPGDMRKPLAGRALDALHPPPTPGVFRWEWLRCLLCEGCGLPATTNFIKCLHCNLVVHYWCRDLRPRSRRGGKRKSIASSKRQSTGSASLEKLGGRRESKGQAGDMFPDWVCWECIDDMALALQLYRGLKNRQMGAHVEKQAAEKIIRFVTWVANANRAIKEHQRAIVIQSHIRMRIIFLRFQRWMHSQKRAIVVAVRSASGLPVGDPITQRCNPYVIVSVVEPSSSDAPGAGRHVQTFCHQLPTRRGMEDSTASAERNSFMMQSTHKNGGGGGGRHQVRLAGEKEKRDVEGGRKEKPEKPQTFRWEEEFLLPGVSDSATIAFTVLHQTPTKPVCLGQALVRPKHFSKICEHVGKVSLEKQSVLVRFKDNIRKDQRRIENVDWEKPGNLTFVLRKSSYCDSYCSEVGGPIAEEIRALALAENHGARVEPTPGNSGGEATADTARPGDQHNRRQPGPPPPLRLVGQGKAPKLPVGAADSQGGTGSGAGGGSGATSGIAQKVGGMATSWWACMWLGRLRLYQNLGDSTPKLNLQLDGWRVLPEDETSKSTRPDLRLVNSTNSRKLFLRCSTKVDLNRWIDVLERNQADEVRRRHGNAHSNHLHDNVSEPNRHQHNRNHDGSGTGNGEGGGDAGRGGGTRESGSSQVSESRVSRSESPSSSS